MTKIYTLANVLGEWMVETKPPTFTNESLSHPLASFIIDPFTGNELLPTAESLQASMRPVTDDSKSKEAHCLWIAASRKSIRCAVNINGDRVAKVELDSDELSDVFYVTRHGECVHIAPCNRQADLQATRSWWLSPLLAMPYSTACHSWSRLPDCTCSLAWMRTLRVSCEGRSLTRYRRPVGRVSFDDRSGDFVEYSNPLDINLRTVFFFRKPFPPRIDPCTLKRPVPYQPAPVTAYSLAWMWGGAALTGAQLDHIVAGPNRPPPPKPPPAPRKPLISWGSKPDEPVKPATPPPAEPAHIKRTAVGKQKAPTRDAREREDALVPLSLTDIHFENFLADHRRYTEMRRATEERGTYMEQLNDTMNNASISATNYLNQARNNAVSSLIMYGSDPHAQC